MKPGGFTANPLRLIVPSGTYVPQWIITGVYSRNIPKAPMELMPSGGFPTWSGITSIFSDPGKWSSPYPNCKFL
jgi:hypothetical protein